MTGLLDWLATPAGQGLLAAGMGYAANARRGAPLNSLGAGGLMGLQAYGGAQQSQLEQAEKAKASQLRDLQLEQNRFTLEEARRKSEAERGLAGLQSQFLQPGAQAQGGTSAINAALPPAFQIGAQAPIAGTAPKFDVQGYTAAAMGKGYMSPLDAFKLQKSMTTSAPIKDLEVKDFTPASVQKFAQTGNYGDLVRLDKAHFADTGGGVSALDPFTGRPINSVPKTGNPYNDLILGDGQGGFRANSPLIGAKKDIAAAGAARTKVDVNNVAETEWSKKRAGDFAEMMAGINKTSFSAPTQVRKLERMEQLLQGVDGGKLAPTGLEIASAAGSLGIKLDPKLGNKEAAQALSREIASGFRQPGTGPMTDKDFDNFLLQVPDLSKTAQGRQQITATMKAAAARDIEIGKRARVYVQKNGKLDDNFVEEVSRFVAENPVVQMPKNWQVTR